MNIVILKIWQFSPHPFNCKKVGRVQLLSNFLLLLSLIAIVITFACEIWTRFLKNIPQKWKYYREEKQEFERVLIFCNIKMLAKSNKIELSEEFMATWREDRPSGMSCSHCIQTKMKKTKVWKECQINFRFFQTDIFE